MKVLGRNFNVNPSVGKPRKTSASIRESWTVDGVEFGSTNSMLANAESFDGAKATYTRTELRSKTLGEKVGGALAGGGKGLIIGAAVNALLSLATGGIPAVATGALVLGGYALGAVVGVSGKPSQSESGTLTTNQGRTTFFPGDVASEGVEISKKDLLLHFNETGYVVA